jgi:hypothetical protein
MRTSDLRRQAGYGKQLQIRAATPYFLPDEQLIAALQ